MNLSVESKSSIKNKAFFSSFFFIEKVTDSNDVYFTYYKKRKNVANSVKLLKSNQTNFIEYFHFECKRIMRIKLIV